MNLLGFLLLLNYRFTSASLFGSSSGGHVRSGAPSSSIQEVSEIYVPSLKRGWVEKGGGSERGQRADSKAGPVFQLVEEAFLQEVTEAELQEVVEVGKQHFQEVIEVPQKKRQQFVNDVSQHIFDQVKQAQPNDYYGAELQEVVEVPRRIRFQRPSVSLNNVNVKSISQVGHLQLQEVKPFFGNAKTQTKQEPRKSNLNQSMFSKLPHGPTVKRQAFPSYQNDISNDVGEIYTERKLETKYIPPGASGTKGPVRPVYRPRSPQKRVKKERIQHKSLFTIPHSDRDTSGYNRGGEGVTKVEHDSIPEAFPGNTIVVEEGEGTQIIITLSNRPEIRLVQGRGTKEQNGFKYKSPVIATAKLEDKVLSSPSLDNLLTPPGKEPYVPSVKETSRIQETQRATSSQYGNSLKNPLSNPKTRLYEHPHWIHHIGEGSSDSHSDHHHSFRSPNSPSRPFVPQIAAVIAEETEIGPPAPPPTSPPTRPTSPPAPPPTSPPSPPPTSPPSPPPTSPPSPPSPTYLPPPRPTSARPQPHYKPPKPSYYPKKYLPPILSPATTKQPSFAPPQRPANPTRPPSYSPTQRPSNPGFRPSFTATPRPTRPARPVYQSSYGPPPPAGRPSYQRPAPAQPATRAPATRAPYTPPQRPSIAPQQAARPAYQSSYGPPPPARPSYQRPAPTQRPSNPNVGRPSYPAASSHWKPSSPETPTSNSASNNHYHIHVAQANQLPQVEAALNSIGSEPQTNPRPPHTVAKPNNPPPKQLQYQPTNTLGHWKPPLKSTKQSLSTAQKLMCLFWCYLDQDNI